MNIFYLHSDTKKCAEMHCDKHVVKMILETAQLLSTAHRIFTTQQISNNSENSILYKATHKNHPSAVWARKSQKNYLWLSSLLRNLCLEYTYRYGKIHAVEQKGLLQFLSENIPVNMPDDAFTEPPQCMPDEFKRDGNSIAAYRQYYAIGKKHLLTYKKREPPKFLS